MKINQFINESAGGTSSGAVASVASPLGKVQKRAGNLFKGKKTSKPFFESEEKCPKCKSTDVKTYSDGEKECNQCHKTWDVKGITEGREPATMNDVRVTDIGDGWIKISVDATAGPLINLMRSIATEFASKPRKYEVKTKLGDKFNRMKFKSNGILVKPSESASILLPISDAILRHNASQKRREKWKATAPIRKKEAAKFHGAQAKQKREKSKAEFGDAASRVKIRQIGGDDGYQWNVIVDGHSIMNGLTKSQAEHYQKKEIDRLAKASGQGKYATIAEGKMKEIATDMKELGEVAFKKKYGKSKEEMRAALTEASDFRKMAAAQQLDAIERIKNSNLSDATKEYLIAINDPKGPVFRAAYKSFARGSDESDKVKFAIAKKYNIDPTELENAELRYRATQLREEDISEQDALIAPGKGRQYKPGLLAKSEPSVNPTDTVKIDIPLLIRLLEYAREDAKTDMDLHDLAEKLIAKGARGKTLNMRDYESLVETTGGVIAGGMASEGDLGKACWKGYKAVGLKKKGSKQVPNCVPIKEEPTSPSVATQPGGWRNTEIKEEAMSAQDLYKKKYELTIAIKKAKNITSRIKHDDVLQEIIMDMEELLKQVGIDPKKDFDYSVSDVYAAQNKLQSEVFKLEDVLTDALSQVSSALDDLEDTDVLDEDWGSSDWSAAIRSFVEGLKGAKTIDDVAYAAYDTANFYNDPRKFSDDPWSHFTPMSLIKLTIVRKQMPEELLPLAQAVLNGEVEGNLSYELGEGFPHDVDHMPGPTKKGALIPSCKTCHGRKAMYKVGSKLYADNKLGATKVSCPTCKGTGTMEEDMLLPPKKDVVSVKRESSILKGIQR